MSRIGRMPIAIPAGVTVEVAENNKVTVKGPKGTLERVLPTEMEIKVEGAEMNMEERHGYWHGTWICEGGGGNAADKSSGYGI